MYTPESIDDVADSVREKSHIRVTGAGTKPAASRDANLSLAKLAGILQYEPTEYTFTALAGTPLLELRDALAENGQYLPFDPPLVEAGATLGGTVACGLTGPGRYRFGGVRDFVLGVRFVSGEGRIVFGGGKVVKNAAGFDLPKLMVGALGQCGVMVEFTFKVFPAPQQYATLRVPAENFARGEAILRDLATSPLELHCLDFLPEGTLWLRVGGLAAALPQRIARLQSELPVESEVLEDEEDATVWRGAREFRWVPPGHSLLKMPMQLSAMSEVEAQLGKLDFPCPRRYSVGGNVLYLAWPGAIEDRHLGWLLRQLERRALALTGRWDCPLLGPSSRNPFFDRLQSVLDPQDKFAFSSAAAVS